MLAILVLATSPSVSAEPAGTAVAAPPAVPPAAAAAVARPGVARPTAVPRAAGPQSQSAGTVHYHVHNHYHYAPTPTAASASGVGPLPGTPPQMMASEAVTNLYAPGFAAFPFAPLPTQNRVSNPDDPNARAADYGTIHVFLPVADAEVYLQGQKMKGTGKSRFLTTGFLDVGDDYEFFVTARVRQGGRMMTDYRKVVVGADECAIADFTQPATEVPGNYPAGPIDPAGIDPN
jgi:uncharacterized protein (TIGR03000 family)